MTSGPGGSRDPDDVDARFAEIVARFDQGVDDAAGTNPPPPPQGPSVTPASPPSPEPSAPETPEPEPPPEQRPQPEDTGQGGPSGWRPREATDGTGTVNPPPAAWRTWEGRDEEEHFVPPAPEPLPVGDLHFWGILVGLVGGPLLLVLSGVFGVLDTTPWAWIGILVSVAGFVLLVLRQPRDRDLDDPSGGARV